MYWDLPLSFAGTSGGRKYFPIHEYKGRVLIGRDPVLYINQHSVDYRGIIGTFHPVTS
jgi:hypothetical protein